MLKKVKKVLNAPVKEETYTPSNNLYMSDRSLKNGDSFPDPARKLRMTQVEKVAQLLLQQISRLEELLAHVPQIDRQSDPEVEATSTEIEMVFEELDRGMLLTETEKAARRLEGAQCRRHGSITDDHATNILGVLRSEIQDWQQEKLRRKKKSNRVESGIRDLALNVNDVRCTQILRDRQTSIAALDSTIDKGIPLLKTIFSNVMSVNANLELLS
jgi:hypothetical protein